MKRFIITALLLIVAGVSVYMLLQAPSNDRDWTIDASRIPTIQENGDSMTIQDVRDWRYDEQGPTEERWIEQTYRPEDITAVWFVVNPFKGWDGVAHTMLVFDFKDREPVVVSVEARRENGEDFWVGYGLFRQYELAYIWGTERDLYTRRAVYWQEELYMYPLAMEHEYAVHLFKELAATTNDLHTKPRFYNSLTSNCTSVLADSANEVATGTVPWNIARILPGYSEEFLFELGYIDAEGSLDEINVRYAAHNIVREVAHEDDFSGELRKRLGVEM